MDSEIGYRQDYEGIGVYVFRHPSKNDEWQVMTLQNKGGRSVLRLENQMYSGLRNMNHCQIDMASGKRAGLRIQVKNKQVITEVKDVDDVSYRSCNKQGLLQKDWGKYHFAIAAKNTPSDTQEMLITDFDIDYLHIASLRPWDMPDAQAMLNERDGMLLKKHAHLSSDGSESVFDINRIFELNLAQELAREQKKTILFVEKEDTIDDLLFKHH